MFYMIRIWENVSDHLYSIKTVMRCEFDIVRTFYEYGFCSEY